MVARGLDPTGHTGSNHTPVLIARQHAVAAEAAAAGAVGIAKQLLPVIKLIAVGRLDIGVKSQIPDLRLIWHRVHVVVVAIRHAQGPAQEGLAAGRRAAAAVAHPVFERLHLGTIAGSVAIRVG